jgi:LmbE family N-acetylglucosaminyl deacetylase
VLSVGATLTDLAAQGTEVHVVTLFAGTPTEPLSAVARTFHTNCGLPEDASAATLRIDEDRTAMHEIGARAHYCGCLDAVYRRAPDGAWLCGHDRAMFDDRPSGRDALLTELSREVNRILATVGPDLVLTCAAVGDHVDHRLTRAAVLDAVNGTELQTLLWEDLPYAINRPPATTSPLIRTISAAELFTHAKTRGEGTPAELMFPTTLGQ